MPENTEINVAAKASSSLHYSVLACFSASTIREDLISFPTFLPNDVVDTTKNFNFSQITVTDASTLTDLFSSRYKLSDDSSIDLHSLFKNLLQVNNTFPTDYSFIKKVKTNFEISFRILEKSSENSFCVLNFRFQIGDIIKRQFFFQFYSTLISEVLMKRMTFPQNSVPFWNSITEKLPLSTWYYFLMARTWKRLLSKRGLANLDPGCWSTAKATIGSAKHCSCSSSCWFFSPKLENLLPHNEAALISGLQIKIIENLSLRVQFKVRLLIADLGPNVTCSTCINLTATTLPLLYVEGITIENSQCY